MSDAFFTDNTPAFLRDSRDKALKALDTYRAELRIAYSTRAAFLRDRIAATENHIALLDAELARRGTA